MCSLYVLRLEDRPADDQQVVYSNRVGQVKIRGQRIRRAGTKVKGTRRKRNSRKRGESET